MNARGGSRIRLVLGLAITAAAILAAVRIVPVYVKSYEFEDSMRTQAKFAGVENKTPETVRDELFQKAKSLELPVQRNQIQVAGRPGGVTITTRYAVPVDLVVYTITLNFDYRADTSSVY